jgi:hypothetical protein
VKLLFVTGLDPCIRSIATLHGYAAAGQALGHEVAAYGEPNPQLPALTYTTDPAKYDFAVFVVHVAQDFPDVPLLARVLDTIPRERRVVIDAWARFNETFHVGHDFNHLEKADGHLGWEWIEAFQAVSATILQPTLTPRRADVRSFLFHGFDSRIVAKPYESAREAAHAWASKPHGIMYVGNNWQRWDQLRPFLEQTAPLREKVGRACLVGWDWNKRPDWAVQSGLAGIDVDPAFLEQIGAEIRGPVRFEETVGLLGQAKFAPVLHRPLFRELGFVTNRTFETFCADTLPVLMLPRDFVEAIYGPHALRLVPGNDVAAHLADALKQPEPYWDAVLRTRAHLARHHSFARRFAELETILKS